MWLRLLLYRAHSKDLWWWITWLIVGSCVLALIVAGVDYLTGDVGTVVSQIKEKIIDEWPHVFLKPSFHPYFWLLIGGVFLLEYWIPARANQRILSVGMLQDLVWYGTNTFLRFLILAVVLDWLHALYQQHLGFLTIQTLQTWPTALHVVVVALASDLLAWCHHFLRHKVWLFWCFHTIHHSQREMNVFTDDRIHVTEPLFGNLLIFVPIFMFGLDLYHHYDEYPETGLQDEQFPLEKNMKGIAILRTYLAQLVYPLVIIYAELTRNAPYVSSVKSDQYSSSSL